MSFSKLSLFLFLSVTLLLFVSCNPSARYVREDKNTNLEPYSRSTVNEKILLTIEGVASYYAHEFHGKKTSSGEIYDMNGYTAAHRVFPFGTKVRVVNLENNKSVIVRVNDRGPFKEDRIIDLSLAAAKKIDLVLQGTARVRLEVLEWGKGQ